MTDIGWSGSSWVRYGLVIGAVAAGFLLRLGLTECFGPGLPTYVTFYPAVMLAAMVIGFWGGLLATVIVVLIAAYWILPPQGFAVTVLSDIVGLVLFSCIAIFLSVVAEKYRRSRQWVQQKTIELAKANEALHYLSSKILSAQKMRERELPESFTRALELP